MQSKEWIECDFPGMPDTRSEYAIVRNCESEIWISGYKGME